MKSLILPSRAGFTLVEMMIVIAIVIALFGVVGFPYAYYMDRSRVERTIDSIGQDWILAHKDIRNGKLFDINKHANSILIFRKGSGKMERYLLSGATLPSTPFDFSATPASSDLKENSPLLFDDNIIIRGFSGTKILETDDFLGYYIEAPYASGAFFTGSMQLFSSTGVYLTIGYPGANLESGRARKILLRPYLQ